MRSHRGPKGRTPLFSAVAKCFRIARSKREPGNSPQQSPRPEALTRREVLRHGAMLGATLPFASACSIFGGSGRDSRPNVVIVGAGMAGLNTCWQLKKAGFPSSVYEAGTRTGGRMYSAKNLVGDGLVTELGAEFIDTTHTDMLRLVKEFGLSLLDMHKDTSVSHRYFFNGSFYTEQQIVREFQPLADRMERDLARVDDIVDFRNEGGAKHLDRLSIEEYFDRIGVHGWIRKLLEVAYVTEYGLEIGEQSALNLLFLIGTEVDASDPDSEFAIFGDSDERFKIVGGNQTLVDEIAKRLKGQISLEHRLEAIRARGSGFVLSFRVDGKKSVDVPADIAVVTLPFTMLREVKLDIPLPEFKRRAIAELTYGTNAKLFVGTTERLWRKSRASGECFSDESFQLCWDNSQLQPGKAGALTVYTGGRAGVAAGIGSVDEQVRFALPGLDRVFPGVSSVRSSRDGRFHWPSYSLVRGSYAAYRPGQWTTVAGAEFEPVGNLLFAGEHTSYDFQGYMNGAAETGRRAAEQIISGT